MEEVGVRFVTEQTAAFFSTMDRADRAVGSFANGVGSHSGRIVGAFSEIATGALRYVGEVMTRAFIDAGRAVIGFAADSVTAAGDFEATANRFSAVAGTAIEDAGLSIEEFSQQWLQLGADTQFSAQQAGDAAVELAKGGVAIADVMGEATSATLNLAAAGELELAPAAEIVAKQLGVWQETGIGATEITDLMAQAANASTLSVESLAGGMAQVGGAAQLAGLSFEETVTAISLISPGFNSASDAGTSFKTFLNSMIPITANQVEAMSDLGLSTFDMTQALEWLSSRGLAPVSGDMNQVIEQMRGVYAAEQDLTFGTMEEIEAFQGLIEETGIMGSAFFDAEGSFVGMEAAAQLLAEATADLTEEQKLVALELAFGSDAQRVAYFLAQQGAQGYNEMAAAMDNAGTAAEQAALRNQGWNFAMETMRGSVETLQIVLGTMLLPTLTRFVQEGLTPAINWMTSLATAVSSSDTPLQTFLIGLNTIIPGIQSLVNNIMAGISIFQAMTSAGIDPLTAGLSVLQAVFPALTPAIETVRTVIATVTPIIQSVVATIADLQARWEAAWPMISAVLETAGIVIMAIVNSIIATVTPAFATLMTHGEEFKALWQAISPIIGAVLAVIGALLLAMLATAVGVFVGITNAITPVITMFTNLANNVTSVADAISVQLRTLIALIQALIAGDFTAAIGLFDQLWRDSQAVVDEVNKAIYELVRDLVESVLAFVEGLYTGVVDFFQALYDDLVGHSIVTDMVRDIIAAFEDLTTRAVQAAQNLWDGVVGKFQGMKDAGLGIIRSFRDEITGILDGIKSAIDTALGWIGNLTSALSGITFPTIPDLPFLNGTNNITVSGLSNRMNQPMGASQQMSRAMMSSTIQYNTSYTLNQAMIPASVAQQSANSFAMMAALS